MTILVIVQSRGSVGIESACLAGDLGLIPGRENTKTLDCESNNRSPLAFLFTEKARTLLCPPTCARH